MKNHYKKIQTLSTLTVLAATQVINSYANVMSVNEKIEEYHLESQRDYINQNPVDFCNYVMAVEQNPTFSILDRTVAMQNFYLLHTYFKEDFQTQLAKIQNRRIIIDEKMLKQEKAEGLFYKDTNTISIKENASIMVRAHENMHHHFDYPSACEVDHKWICINGLEEALASDLAGRSIDTYGFFDTYFLLTQQLQALYHIYGKDQIITALKSPDAPENIWNLLKGSEEEKTKYLNDLNAIYQIEVENETNPSQEEVIPKLVDDLTKMYEKVKQTSWQEDTIFINILQAILKQGEPAKETSFMKDIKNRSFSLMENEQMALIVDINGKNYIKITHPVLTNDEMDTQIYEENSDHSFTRITSYNHNQEMLQKTLQYQGVPSSLIPLYFEHWNTYVVYENIINTTYQTVDEKIKYQNEFPIFIATHPHLFTSTWTEEMIPTLLRQALTSDASKEQKDAIFYDENALIELGGQKYLEELSQYGYSNQEQKDILFYLSMFEEYQIELENITDETKKEEELHNFYHYLQMHPEWQNASYEELHQSFKEILNITEKKRVLFP